MKLCACRVYIITYFPLNSDKCKVGTLYAYYKSKYNTTAENQQSVVNKKIKERKL